MTHQVSLLGWRIEQLGNFGCTQSLVSRHSHLLTFGRRRSIKSGQGVDQGIAQTSRVTDLGDAVVSAVIPQQVALLHTADWLVIATVGRTRLLQSTIGPPQSRPMFMVRRKTR